MSQSTRYLVGIDLGTTHTVVAYADLRQGREASIERFAIPQLIAPGEIADRSLLPSVRYHPAEGELAPASLNLPWTPPDIGDPVPGPVIGELARQLGAKSQGRLVTSAKSWLCNPNVDRTADILPWGAPQEVSRVSPLIACASYLAHVRGAWNVRFPEHPLERQEVVVTIPASFDEAARALTVEAANIAGISRPRLLEEPQAVCYDWLYRHRDDLSPLADSRLLLVADLGGGTTDLTLIRIQAGANGRSPRLTRVGVGDHLLLGGDNIDLMLAHLVEERLLDQGHKLSTGEFSQLIEQCRIAKERLLADPSPDQATVTVLGSGTKLIGGARSVILGRDEVHEVVLEGFFCPAPLAKHPQSKRSGLVEFGLPYEADPAVTRHIAAFLKSHAQVAQEALGDPESAPVPDTVLLNGGVFLSPVITDRLLQVLESWRPRPITTLDNPHPEFAVASGAVAYAMARRGFQTKIGGGSARSYFLVVESEAGESQGMCLLPRGTEEEQEILLEDRVFALRLGQPVRFHLVSSTEDTPYTPGDKVPLDNERFTLLPPLAMALSAEDKGEVQVRLAARLTEIGTLELECVALDDPGRRWRLAFELRRPSRQAQVQDVSHPHLEEARNLIRAVFGKKSKDVSPKLVKTLRGELEKRLGPRHRWDVPLLRALADTLLEGIKFRRRSPEHERTWFSLTGFCLRPGFGYPLDEWRIEQVWPIYRQGLQFVNVIQNWAEWWTFWRRIAGGLDPAYQNAIFQDLTGFMSPAKLRQKGTQKNLKLRSNENMIRLAAVLEHLPVDEKIQLGGWFLTRLQSPKEPEEILAWALGRLGSRDPFYGSTHNTVPAGVAEHWLQTLLTLDFKQKPALGFAAALLARRSGDRARDIHADMRVAVIQTLQQAKAPASWIKMAQEVVKLSEEDEKRLFGEALPPGLKLIA
ncbi:MAG: Hsp70 family protein [Methylohalobius sp. ZOD2]